MSTTDETTPRVVGKSSTSLLASFVVATLISSSLLFLIQPLMAKLMLPLFGGSSSVWAVSMSFFQAMLLIGYGYAHLLRKHLSLRSGIILHVLLMAVGLYLLRFDATTLVDGSNGEIGTLALLTVLAKTVGFPFAVMSANAPLTQSWFSQSTHKNAEDPYFLYAASNLGSMFALLAYPFVIEPLVGLQSQTNFWTAGFLVLTLGLGACGLVLLNGRESRGAESSSRDDGESIAWARRLTWLIYAFVPSALLSAWTNHITMDVASAPFLWLPPLALYLASFVLMFRARPLVSMPFLRILLLLSLPVAYVVNYGVARDQFMIVLAAGAITFMSSTCILHRKMFEDRPGPANLTEFYFIMSLGGVLGGSFVSLLAPILFSNVTEYPLLLIAAFVLGTCSFGGEATKNISRAVLPVLCIFVLAYLIRAIIGQYQFSNGSAWSSSFLFATWAGLLFLLSKSNQRFVMYVSLIPLLFELAVVQFNSIGTFRNFYGVLSIDKRGEMIVMKHGTTIHGAAFLEDLDPARTERPRPLTYYSPDGGMAQSVITRQMALSEIGTKGTYGIIGLGAGTLACYSKPGETWKFFEINAIVTQLAKDPQYFPYMQRCAPNAPVIMGDARLTMQKELDKTYDVLIIDAFSSDAVPVHLLTIQAMELYMRLLKDGGVIAFHVSNKHLDLQSVISSNVSALNRKGNTLDVLNYLHEAPANYRQTGVATSHVMILSKSDVALSMLRKSRFATEVPESDVSPWTDDYSNVISAIMRQQRVNITASTTPHQSQ
jgi:hypothetical protein